MNPVGNPFYKTEPNKYVCGLCQKNYFAYMESLNKQCAFCSGEYSRLIARDFQMEDDFLQLMARSFTVDPPWMTDPTISEETPPPPGTMPPQSLPPGYPRKAYNQEDSPNVVRDEYDNVTDYWNGQRWVHITRDGEEW